MISSKFLPPQAPAGIVRRLRLLHLLHNHVGRPLTVVAAPAGYGKTTLVADWAADVDLRVCWLNLDVWDREFRPFLAAIEGAISSRAPDLGVELLPLAETGEEAPARAARVLAGSLAAAEEFTVLVLDDYHLIDDAPQPRAFIEALLAGPTDGFQLVLLSRIRPSLRSLGRLVLRRQALILGPGDLAFTEGETRELFRNLYHEDITADEAAALAAQTEGWAAALLLTRSTAHPADFDSLAAEALAALPPRLRRFLLHTSPLPFLTPDLCDAVLRSSRSDQLLRRAAERTLFLTPVDAAVPSYRYHQLLRSFLLSRFAAREPAGFARACGRAADALRERGYVLDAISLLIEARAWRRAAETLVAAGDTLIARGHSAAALALLESLPPESRSPGVRLLRGRLLYQLQRVDEALAEFDWVRAARGVSIAEIVRADIGRGQALAFKGHHANAEEAFANALDRAQFLEEGRSAALRAEALRHLGISRAMQGRIAQAVPDLEEARDLFDSLGRTAEFASTCNTLSYCHSARGDQAAALRAMEQTRSALERLGNRYELSVALNNIGMLYAEIGEFETSLSIFDQAKEMARAAGNRRSEALALASAADARRALGQRAQAAALYEESLAIARGLDDAYLLATVYEGRLLLHLEEGNPAAARLLLPLATDDNRPHARPLLEGRIALAEGALEPANALFEAAAIAAAEAGSHREAAIAWFMAGVAAYRRRRRSLALAAFGSAVGICEETGYSRFLLPDVRAHHDAVAYAAARGVGAGVYRRLLQDLTAEERVVREMPPGREEGIEASALGKAEVRAGGREITDVEWRSEKAREMFFYLLFAERGKTKEQIFSALWDELPTSKCNSNFHSTLHRLRRAVGADAVITSGSHYRLNQEKISRFDVWEFRDSLRAAVAARDNPEQRLRHLRAALGAYGGPFLPTCYSEWAAEARRSLEQIYARALAETAALEERRGAFGQALEVLERAAQIDPYDEQLALAMMRCQRAMGEHQAALVTFRRFADLLRDDLAAVPSARLASLAEAIAAEIHARPLT